VNPSSLTKGARSRLRAQLGRHPRLRELYRRSRIELRFLRFALREGLWRAAFRLSAQEDQALKGQALLWWDTKLPEVTDSGSLADWLRTHDVRVSEGGHTLYVPPQPALAELLPDLVRDYPAGSGFKILRDARPPHEAHYLTRHGGRPVSKLRRNLVGLPREQLVTANYLYDRGLGPRVWDVCSLRAGGNGYTAFVVDHVEGDSTTPDQWQAFRDRLEDVLSQNQLAVTIPDWRSNGDFGQPDCRGNLIASSNGGGALYVDFQNFRLRNPGALQRDVARHGRRELHFGRTRVGRGGAYLYQSIPGVRAGGKRNSSKRWLLMTKLLADAGVQLKDRVVLDVGCNAGMMLHSALSEGAFWGVGWDLPEVVGQAEPLLLALGTTRFHLIGARLSAEYPLEDDLPPEVERRLDEAVLFYLSVVNHVGVMDSLNRLPWRALVFEGHQGEPLDDAERHVAELLDSRAVVAGRTYVGDGDSKERPLLLLVRRDSNATD
jgi:hypothetical protein